MTCRAAWLAELAVGSWLLIAMAPNLLAGPPWPGWTSLANPGWTSLVTLAEYPPWLSTHPG